MKKSKANSELSVEIQLKEERRRKCANGQKMGQRWSTPDSGHFRPSCPTKNSCGGQGRAD
ncbi:hypothetical protein RchiOBHm_Chr0c13g0499651 [Rosa chinensis]|uniref:Uncharacterized protein n=1 Tax=Rosa chinensis TaxID=74649 RepID=A0A2P6SQP7_ROSCH|nr:hypothetical protein RchiOBHm_Chr0c13g0499651 [Rosa chinensis]